ncbi:MAG: hypothetical protein AUI50_03125 [Crenarchaeota archaeon 13_1_40CM_2_52_14]|nr:MAG: hypothetical protein AUI97_04990 [Crenarchaeota archaeon 13_1_40CM_3_52_17]OLD35200.1 MAG: hypothetical protein AUI50_03125 [Crenarchaeota archaeon 13_1_40CM_2_52_14]
MYLITDVLEITFSFPIFERVEINSSVIPSAKYSSFGSGLMFMKGRIAIRSLPAATSCIFESAPLRFGPLSQPLIPSPSPAGFS